MNWQRTLPAMKRTEKEDERGRKMKSSDVEIMKCFLCTVDRSLPFPNYNEIKIDEEDSIYSYIQKLVAGSLQNTAAMEADFSEGAYLDAAVTDDPEDLEMFVQVVTDIVYDLVKNNAELHSGSGIFVFCIVDEQPFIGFFKMHFQERYLCKVAEDGKVSWVLNSKVLPKCTQKDYDFFLINILERKVKLSDVENYIDDCKVNYIAEYILKLQAKPSEKEKVAVIRETTIKTIRECYDEKEVPQKIMEYKTEVADHVDKTGRVSVAQIEKKVFADNERAADVYREKLEAEQIEREPIPVSKKTERQFTKKQKIVTDNGIELLVPVEYLKNADYVEYVQDEEGNISIIIKSVHAIEA